ncbi:hypothetical protein PV04_10914 [Phialophora macrospora]|uniref:Zn(2)-C6 fungal-type domain-containing protein n=1 Tax=Phialophora macrospora TaxID=1851006 RepID=A0A0D2DK37_9EURO|nr:hypothetical protein PV04_10914 [Phialophora macrospora]
MGSRYRVRFATAQNAAMTKTTTPCIPHQVDRPNQRRHSRSGCHECKRRRVKCDETLPVCLRCQRRRSVCRSVPRRAQWVIEVPWLNPGRCLSSLSSHVNLRSLQYWLERASQIMVIDPEINPLSFPILKYLDASPSLLHSLQSISVAHEGFFSTAALTSCLEERARALAFFREELLQNDGSAEASFLTMYILGMSAAWTDQENKIDIGQPHLHGARALIDMMVAEAGSIEDPFVQLALGCYIYWDQASAFFVTPQQQTPLNTPEIYHCISPMRRVFHPVAGYSTEIYYLLSTVGRYCRAILDHCPRDPALEETLEQELLDWESPEEDRNLYLVSNAFRKHGLVMLYRTTASAGPRPACPGDRDTPAESETERRWTEEVIRQCAREILDDIMEIPPGCSYHIVLALPLLTAGAELGEDEPELRDEVRKRFRALFSMNRIPANLWAIEMLEELWALHAAGSTCSWLSLALQKNWNLLLL